jgi:hypothetical protein
MTAEPDTCGAPWLVSQNRKTPFKPHSKPGVKGYAVITLYSGPEVFLAFVGRGCLITLYKGIGTFMPPDQFRGWLVMAITLCQLSKVSQNNIVTGIKLAKAGRMVIRSLNSIVGTFMENTDE